VIHPGGQARGKCSAVGKDVALQISRDGAAAEWWWHFAGAGFTGTRRRWVGDAEDGRHAAEICMRKISSAH
jgi:hypothetical protein